MAGLARELLWIILVLGSGRASGGGAMERLWYMTGGSEDSVASFLNHADSIDVVAPQVYSVRPDGSVHGAVDGRVLLTAFEKGIHVMPLIMNPGFNQKDFAQLLANEDATKRVAQFMVDEATRFKFWGWQFDFENIHLSDAPKFKAFYKLVADSLRIHNFKVSIAVVPGAPGSHPSTYHQYMNNYWRGVFWENYEFIAEYSDFVSLMTYSQHTLNTPPGPIAGLPWMRAMIDEARKRIPLQKLSIGIPTYSNRWNAIFDEASNFVRPSGGEIHHSEAVGLIASVTALSEFREKALGKHRLLVQQTWDDREGVTMVVTENEFIREHICLENARSFDVKIDMVKELGGVRGISVWVLGAEDEDIWPTVTDLGQARC